MTSGDISDRFTVQIDPEAAPSDWDEAVARFLLRIVTTLSGASAEDESNQTEATESR
jgi:hypothetical protein